MNTRTIALFALLTPGLLMLAACDRTTGVDADDTTPAASAATDTMPADTTPTDSMATDNGAMSGMTGDEMSFADMDKNHDGSITHDELSNTDMLDQHFSVADTDADGKLSEAEVMKHRADMAAAPGN